MRRKFEGLTDRVDGTRDVPAAVGGESRSIYDVEIYRPLPVHLARLLKQLDQVDDRVRGLRAGGDDHLTGRWPRWNSSPGLRRCCAGQQRAAMRCCG